MRARPFDTPAVAAALLILLTLLLGLPGLGSASLFRMEGMVAAMSGEMLRSGDFAVSRLYGEIYTYKPPFLYWLVAGARVLTGSSAEWVIRLPGVLCGLAMGLATLGFVGKIAGYRLGLLAAVAALVNGLFAQKLRVAEFDAPVAAFVGIAVAAACFALATGDERRTTGVWVLCYTALTAAVLTKGAPGLMLFVPGLIGAAFATGKIRTLAERAHLTGLCLMVVLVTAYAVAAHAGGGWEVFAHPLAEARERGAGWSLETVGRTLLKPAMIWALFLPWSLGLLWSWPNRAPAGDRLAIDRLRWAAWSFLIGGTVAFMAVPTHEPRYYLPLSVPLAIAAVLGLRPMALSPTLLSRALPVGLAGTIGAATLALGLWPASPAATSTARSVLILLGIAALSAAAALARSRSRELPLTMALLLAALCLWVAETQALGPKRAAGRDQRGAALELLPRVPVGATLWTVGPAGLAGSYSGLLHYLERPVRTFSAGQGPPAGSLCVLRTQDLEGLAPAVRERLVPIASTAGPRWSYSLYRAGS